MLNPFTIRGTLQNPEAFIGRGAEINDIVTRLRSMQSCSVVGERRIGKSSLLYHLYQTGVEIKKGIHDDNTNRETLVSGIL